MENELNSKEIAKMTVISEQFNNYSKLEEITKQLNEVPAKNNFLIEIKDISTKDNTEYLISITKDKKQLHISQFLPEGHKLIYGDTFQYFNYLNIILFDEKRLNNRGFLLDLFHEIGHAHVNQLSGEQWTNERNAWAYALKQLRKIKKETGIDGFTRFKNSKEIHDYISCCLLTYECAAMATYFDQQWIENWKPMFEKKTRYIIENKKMTLSVDGLI